MTNYGEVNQMTKTEAFNALGYPHHRTQGVWTTERDGRVLVTLWDREIRKGEGCLFVDMDQEHPRGTGGRIDLPNNPKHMARARRLKRVMDGRAGLDVVILFGPVGIVESAMPWHAQEQFNREWRVVSVRPEDGFFRMEAS